MPESQENSIYFSAASGISGSLRSRLLVQTLRIWSDRRSHAAFSRVADIGDAAGGIAALAGLGAFAAARDAQTDVFVGLVNAAAAHLGRNVLICPRPLRDELAALAARVAPAGDLPALWWRDVLRNYERIVFLDPDDCADSAGFVPWARLSMVEGFAVGLPRPDSGEGMAAPRILVVNHDPATPEGELLADHPVLSRLAVDAVLSAQEPPPGPPVVPAAHIHIHHGWHPHRVATLPLPRDSLIGGFYTIVLPGTDGKSAIPADSGTKDLCAARSYGLLAADETEALRFTEQARNRILRFGGGQGGSNPEIERYQPENDAYRAAMFGALVKRVFA